MHQKQQMIWNDSLGLREAIMKFFYSSLTEV